jgi:hypothetical protein
MKKIHPKTKIGAVGSNLSKVAISGASMEPIRAKQDATDRALFRSTVGNNSLVYK